MEPFPHKDRPELKRLLEEAASRKLTPREIWLQRVNWAYGQAAIGNPKITREQVERSAIEIYGPCPERA